MSHGSIVAAGFSLRKVAMKNQNTRNLKVAATLKTGQSLKLKDSCHVDQIAPTLCQVEDKSLVRKVTGCVPRYEPENDKQIKQ